MNQPPPEDQATMSADTAETTADSTSDVEAADAAAATPDPSPSESTDNPSASEIKVPEFSALSQQPIAGAGSPLDRFYDVHVPVWAELGRVEMPLGELMKLDEGSVLRLDRPVSEPVDLISQGVKLARGEVVVVDDCFAIRIKSIETPVKK